MLMRKTAADLNYGIYIHQALYPYVPRNCGLYLHLLVLCKLLNLIEEASFDYGLDLN